MNSKLTAVAMLDREFLEVRCRLIDIAAALDRMDRASDRDAIRDDPRMAQLAGAVGILIDDKPDRARRVQLAFSDPYAPNRQDR